MILDLTPGNVTLRLMLACELANKLKGKGNYKMIELGCGEGDLTQYLFKTVPDLKLEILDISPEMLALAEGKLKGYEGTVEYIQADAHDYLMSAGENKYDVIVSAWTIHNFPWDDKKKMFKQIFSSLKPGGVMFLMDKIYADNSIEAQDMYDAQINRYKRLSDLVREDMLKHEAQDYSSDYKMTGEQTRDILQSIGFKNYKVIDRIERDTVISVEK